MLFVRIGGRANVRNYLAWPQRHEPPGHAIAHACPRGNARGASGPAGIARLLASTARTYGGGAMGPIAPGTPTPGTPTGTNYRPPLAPESSPPAESPQIRIPEPPSNSGPQLTPTPAPHPTNENLTTARPVYQASYFQLLPSPPASVPAQMISAPGRALPPPADDGGWEHAGP